MAGRVGEMATGMGLTEGSGKKLNVDVQDTNWTAGRSGLIRGCLGGRWSG